MAQKNTYSMHAHTSLAYKFCLKVQLSHKSQARTITCSGIKVSREIVGKMGSKAVALLLSLNLLFFSMVSAGSSYKPSPSSPVALPPSPPNCPDLSVCLNILSPQEESCCPLIDGLIDLEAAVCLCARIKATIIGIPIDLTALVILILNNCGKSMPPNYSCV